MLNHTIVRRLSPLAPLGALVLLFACSSFAARETVVLRANFALYRIQAADYPNDAIRAELGPPRNSPELSAQQIMALLGAFAYKRELTWSRAEGRVFERSELEYFAPLLAEALRNTSPDYRLVLVSRHDPDRSVLSRSYRTTAVLWTDANGLNLLFGEIREPTPANELFQSADWNDIAPISFRRAYPDLELKPDEFYQFKTVGGFTHLTWAVVDPDRIESLADVPADAAQSNPASTDSGAAESAQDQKPPEGATISPEIGADKPQAEVPATAPASLRQRLTDLNRALEEGLITAEEYQRERTRILNEH
jgi:hypothetical protein